MTLRRQLPALIPACVAATLVVSLAEAQEPSQASDASEESPHELEGIVVEAALIESKRPAPSTTTTLKREDLERMEEDDVHQVLLKVPGVQIRGEDGMGLRPNIGIRGTSPNRSTKVTLMEDGILLGPAPYSAPAAYYFPMVTRMTAVEVHKGGSQIIYGPRTMGGAINMVTAEIPDGWGGYADIAIGQHSYTKLHGRGGYSNERTGFLLEAIHTDSNGFKELDGGGNTGFSKNEFMAKWRLRSNPNAAVLQQLEAKFGFATETSNETYLGLTDEDFEDSPYRRYVASSLDEMNWHRGQAQLTYSVFPNDDLELRVTGYRNQFTRDWFKVDGMGADATLDDILQNPDDELNRVYYSVLTGQENSDSNDELILLADNNRWYVSEGIDAKFFAYAQTGKVSHEVETGARFHYDEVNRHHTRHTFQMAGASDDTLGSLQPTGAPVKDLDRNRGQSNALALHVTDTLAYDALTLTPGLRAEFVWTKFSDELNPEANNEQFQLGLLPGIGAHYALTDRLGVLAGVYRGFGPVAPQAAKADPETSTTVEAGSRYTTPLLHAELIGFFTGYQNLTANCNGGQSCFDQVGTQFDAGKVNVWGIEALLAKEWNAGNLNFPARATYSLSMSEFRTAFDSGNPEWGDVEVGDGLPYLPVHQASLALGMQDKRRWGIDGTATFVSQAREEAGSGPISEQTHTDGYALVGLAARFKAVEHLWFYVRATNLFDSTYLASRRPHGARPGAPRWFHLGFKIQ